MSACFELDPDTPTTRSRSTVHAAVADIADADEVAPLVSLLCRDSGSSITGASIDVAAGKGCMSEQWHFASQDAYPAYARHPTRQRFADFVGARDCAVLSLDYPVSRP